MLFHDSDNANSLISQFQCHQTSTGKTDATTRYRDTMLGLSRVARRARINVGNLGIRQTSSRADNSAHFEKLKYASAVLLPVAGGMLAYFLTNYSAAKVILEDVSASGCFLC